MTRSIFLFALLSFAALDASAQLEGYVEVPHRGIVATHPFRCFLETGLYDEAKLKAAAAKPSCADLGGIDVDPEKNSLVYYRVGGDCHMRIAVKVFRNDAEQKYRIIINNISGVCRASGTRAGWIIFEKLPPGFNVTMQEVQANRTGREDFAFPKPPSVIKREKLAPPVEIDLKGCLPLTGQSQWVIQNDGHLQTAIGHGDDAERCREVFNTLAIDLSKYTLAGYSFASGHCGRPPRLSLSAVKETSTDPTENRILVMAIYESAGKDYCKVWTTYGVWSLVPKLPEGYGIRFDSMEVVFDGRSFIEPKF